MQQQDTFIFKNRSWDPRGGRATFSYQIQHGNETFDFVETLTFPKKEINEIPEALQKKLLDNLLLALGISYYKLFCPKEIVLETVTLSTEQAEFWNTVYTKGLGEFFYQNKIDYRGLVQFPYSSDAFSSPVRFSRQDRSLVGVGGGKDSIVTAELLKAHNKSFSSFILNTHSLQEEVAQLIGKEPIEVARTLDPQLFELNKRDDVYNGHIPISAIYAWIGIFAAALFDYRYVIVSNEQSSNYGNVDYLGMEVNHQWSKSFAFEKMLQDYLEQFVTEDIHYFSLLRPLTELGIVKQFVQYPQYFTHFSSCNRNFRIREQSTQRWCGECAKCAFAFVLLAAFLPQEEVIQIFGQNLFAKAELLQTYKELLGVAAIKPFDCVGTPEEVIVAFSLASEKGGYAKDIVMRFFQEEVLPKITDSEKNNKESNNGGCRINNKLPGFRKTNNRASNCPHHQHTKS